MQCRTDEDAETASLTLDQLLRQFFVSFQDRDVRERPQIIVLCDGGKESDPERLAKRECIISSAAESVISDVMGTEVS